MAEDKHDAAGSRPFQLRPSILSSSGFGNAAIGANEKSSKGFVLRPSALTSAADKLDSLHKADNRKRPLENDKEDDSVKQDVSDESKKTKVAEEAPKTEISQSLTEDIPKPIGIGSFGFADSAKNNSGTNKSNGDSVSKANYFQQGLDSKSEKLSFVFGANKGTSFSSLQSENNNSSSDSDSAALNNEATSDKQDDGVVKEKLLENADQYQKTHNQRQQYTEVEQFTGEEGEQPVLQVFCKLHLFDNHKKSWLEKGRGLMRLNDICQAEGVFQSRLVFRTQGTNLVLLNTMLWADMICERVKDKSVRIAAVDPDTKEVRVYLITTALKDCSQTHTAIDRRIQALKRNRSDETPSSNDSKTRTDDDDEDSSNEVDGSKRADESQSENAKVREAEDTS